jgi:signal transduction histidine kinase
MHLASRSDRVRAIQAFIVPRSERIAGLVGSAIVPIAMAADYWTGANHSPLTFYLVPVIYAAWFSSAFFGKAIAITTSAALVATELATNFDTHQHLTSSPYNAATGVLVIWLLYTSIRQVRRKMGALRDANRKLEIANKQRERLFRVVSHDLRTPFNALLGYTELLEKAVEGSSKETIREYVSSCRAAAKAAYRLLEDLLVWAALQIDAGKAKSEAVEVEPMLRQCIGAFQSAAALKGVNLLIAPIEPDLSLTADRAGIATVLRNLTDNALKFTDRAGTVTVEAKPRGNSVEISVCDSGRGIPPERLETLFDYGTGRSTPGTGGEPGTGLGLPLCKELVEQNGGELIVNSEPGKGTRISIRLPRSTPSPDRQEIF